MSVIRAAGKFAFSASLCLLATAQPGGAAITIDLSYVNQPSAEFTHFKDFVDAAVAGNPGYAFSAADVAYMLHLRQRL